MMATSLAAAQPSPDVEAAVLASVSSDVYLLSKAVDEGLRPELFHSLPAQTVAKVLLALHGEGARAVDLRLVRDHVDREGLLGSQLSEYLSSLDETPVLQLDQLIASLELLHDRSSREDLLRLSASVREFAGRRQPGGPSVAEFTATALQELLRIQKQRPHRRLKPVAESVRRIVTEMGQRPKGQSQLLGFSLAPFERLNEVLSGLRPGFYYGLAGAPRRGKTNFALQLASSIARNHRIPVLFYSWEQTQRVLAARLLGKESGLNSTGLLSESLDARPGTSDRLRGGLRSLQGYSHHLFLLEGRRQDTLDAIRATAYKLMHDFRSESVAVFLDYLQKIPLQNPPNESRARIDEISTGLADLSLELACPVFAISSIDKEGCRLDDEPTTDERYEDLASRTRPTMHNCTGSGDIEYDLDVALILSKDWIASRELAELLKSERPHGDTPPRIDIVELHVDKNRDAPAEVSPSIQYAFFVHENKFVELDYKTEDQDRPDFRGFAKAQEIRAFLTDRGHLQAR